MTPSITASTDELRAAVSALVSAVQNQTQVLQTWLRPHVIVDLFPRRQINMLYFRVRNVGPLPAFQIKLSVDPPVMARQKSTADLNLFNDQMSVLGPHEEVSFFFDSALDMLGRDQTQRHFYVDVKYVGPNGENYHSQITVNVDILRNLALELPTADQVVDQLRDIQVQVKKMADYATHLRTEALMKAYVDSSREDDDSAPSAANVVVPE